AAALPTLTVSYAGFVNGDTAANLTTAPTVATTATASSHVSGNPYSITASGAVDSDYTISYVTGALTVDPVALTITAENQTKAYAAALPTLNVSYAGFVNGDTAANLTTAPTVTTTATASSHVSGNPYSITASGAVDSDYTISYVAGALTVDPVALTITADNQTKAYGAALPTLTVSYAGFVNGDTAANLTAAPTATTTATAASQVSGSPYSITASGAVDSDYTISYVAGAMTVNPVAATWTTNPNSKTYGSADPSPLTTGSGTFLAADNVTATYSRVAGEDVGGYPITATLSSTTLTAAQLAADYIITNAGATFTIIAATSAPNFAEVYTVPGTPGAAETLDVDWVSRQAAYNDEVGWFTVSSLSGTVGGVAPGASGYAQAAVTSTSHVIFPSGDQGGESATLSVQGGQLIVFYLVQNATTADFLANNPSDSISRSPLIFFTATAANPDNFQHVQVIQNPTIGQVQYNWEDMNTGGDKDFNDVVMTVSPAGTPSGSIDALQVPSSGSAVNIAAVLLGDTSLDSAPGDIGFYYVSDASGDVAGIAPGSPGYAAAALTSGNYQVLFGPGASADNIASDSAPAGSYIAFYAISNGTTSQLMATNSSNSATGGPVSFFSFTSANPDSTDHFRFFSPEGVATNPSQLTLHIMDQLFGNDNDYDGLALNLNIGSS
ncbi:MAG TPA: MBG domain-containing protein, partial [Pirellulales bacterium]|nr:MBG domain-containing protein [Pirellulales bacterium]